MGSKVLASNQAPVGNKKAAFGVLIVFLCSSLLCLLSLSIEHDVLVTAYRKLGFSLLFFTVVYWVITLLPSNGQQLRQFRFSWQFHGILLLVLVITGLMFLVSPIQFRILADETNLISVSYSMFMGHSFANVTESLYFYQQHHPLNSTLDIRPNFYPFLIYIVHVVKGYSAYNGFVVNYFAGALSLWCMYWLLSGWFRWQIALFGMLMLAAYPVFVLWVTASGFEVVNLAMALLSFCFFRQYLEKRQTKELERLLLTLVLLSQTRYESAVVVIAIGFCLLISMRSEYLLVLPKRLAVIPWLFLPVAWHRLIKTDKTDYQVYGDDKIFGLDNLLNNIVPAYDYFSAKYDWYGTIDWVFYLAIAGFVLAVVKIFTYKAKMSSITETVFLAGALSFLALMVVVFSYYWGNLTNVFTLRLGIIFIPFLIIATSFFLNEIFSWYSREPQLYDVKKLVVVAGISAILFYWPVAARNEAVEKLTLNRLYQNTLAFLHAEFPDHNNLIITDRPGMYSVHQWGAVSVLYAHNKTENIFRGLERKLFQNVIVIQEIYYKSGKANDATVLPEAFELESLYETQFDADKLMRISRVVGQNKILDESPDLPRSGGEEGLGAESTAP